MIKSVRKPRTSKKMLTLIAALAGGTTVTSCDTRIKTAVVDGLEQTVLGLLDPANYIDEDSFVVD